MSAARRTRTARNRRLVLAPAKPSSLADTIGMHILLGSFWCGLILLALAR